ncbi:MAG TPA: inositol monophosphatase family protein [Gemmataceae bacterium]|nr:inositol monophosphatase family protein [Gemmataceae bacterium]
MTTDDALTDYLDAACEAARRGAAVLEEWHARFSVREKARFDLVTDADLGSQRAVRSYLQQRFPDHGFLGEEEAGPKGRLSPDAPPTWIVDPLDGTTNYVHDCPLYCVSIGLMVAGELIVGAVLDPSRKELFQAAKGRGAWVNERRLRTSQAARLDEALLGTGFPPDVREHERQLDWWRYFSLHALSLRRTGSTAINLAWTAAGRFDGFWAFDNHVWDVAGGVVLIREAGGVVTAPDGGTYDPFSNEALASNGPLHAALLEAMRQGP